MVVANGILSITLTDNQLNPADAKKPALADNDVMRVL